ncbi:hypothetical protein FA95DRAFT_1014347 [Auriscalpium vulgare]|uniref:Uncharacterized protein n=1 Tax=Auriscalpium vulgare TaxID=40419 RepID=A0ACB8RXM7_9AGAM|nr:hypothetical protein FA95DRAFT_1014347 [Auriscalpium vulgare]
MCEGPSVHHLAVFDKLQRLRAYNSSRTRAITFEELPFAPAPVGMELSPHYSSVTTFVSGTYDNNDALCVHVMQMPSAMRGLEERRWTIELGAPYELLGVDASQDLLVVQEPADISVSLTATVCMLTLSTGESHPLALDTRIRMQFSHRVEVFGDYCAAESDSGAEREHPWFTIWNWKTSAEVEMSRFGLGSAMRDFAFLDSSHVAILQLDYHIYVYELGTGHHPTTFKLPPDSRPWNMWNMGLATSNSVSDTDHPGVFHPDPSARIVSIFSPSDDFLLAVPVGTFLGAAWSTTVPWADWGPACRLIPCHLPGVLPCPCHSEGALSCVGQSSAMRVVVFQPITGEGPDSGHVAVLADFHPERVAQARLRGPDGLVEAKPDEGPSGRLTNAALPYVRREFKMPWDGERVDRPYKVLLCEDQLFVFELLPGEDHDSLVKAWACTI